MKQRLFLLLTVLILTGCAAKKEDTANMSEVASQPADNETVTSDTEPYFHPERYTEEQKAYVLSYAGTDVLWEMETYTDGMVENMLLGTGGEAGHKTSGIASGFFYEGDRTDIPETAGDEMLTLEVIEQWVREGKDFRLEEIAPYQHTIEWNVVVDAQYQHPIDCNEEFFHDASGFRIRIPVVYSTGSCELTIRGGISGDKILIFSMSVLIGEKEDSWAGSVYHHMNFIRTVFKDENHHLEHVTVSVMAGSVDQEGCYLIFMNNTDKKYTVPEQALVDGEIPVRIMQINGESMEEDDGQLLAHNPRADYYAEWDSLEHGEHELTVELKGTFGRKKQVTVPFTY